MEQSHGAVCQPDERISLLITNMIKRNNTYNEGFWEIYKKKEKKMGGETYFVTLSEYIEADVEFNGRAFVFAFML